MSMFVHTVRSFSFVRKVTSQLLNAINLFRYFLVNMNSTSQSLFPHSFLVSSS
jgi:hypothetical protein